MIEKEVRDQTVNGFWNITIYLINNSLSLNYCNDKSFVWWISRFNWIYQLFNTTYNRFTEAIHMFIEVIIRKPQTLWALDQTLDANIWVERNLKKHLGPSWQYQSTLGSWLKPMFVLRFRPRVPEANYKLNVFSVLFLIWSKINFV